MIRKATLQDIPEIHRLVEQYAIKGLLLHRSENYLVDHIRDFTVKDVSGRIVGCSALHVYAADLAEVKSLAVDEMHTRQGWGSKLVRHELDEAASLGIRRVFVLTYQAPFFEKLGFRLTDKKHMPEKIWGDCRYCRKYDDCDEVCMVIEVPEDAPAPFLTLPG